MLGSKESKYKNTLRYLSSYPVTTTSNFWVLCEEGIKKTQGIFIFLSLLPNISYSKWFEPWSISSLSSVIVRVSVVLKRTVGDSD